MSCFARTEDLGVEPSFSVYLLNLILTLTYQGSLRDSVIFNSHWYSLSLSFSLTYIAFSDLISAFLLAF